MRGTSGRTGLWGNRIYRVDLLGLFLGLHFQAAAGPMGGNRQDGLRPGQGLTDFFPGHGEFVIFYSAHR